MSRKPEPFSLPDQAKRSLKELLHKGVHAARTLNRARILLKLDQGLGPRQIAREVGVCEATVYNIRDKAKAHGWEVALAEPRRSGRGPRIEAHVKAKITALACSDPPKGHARWTLRLLADRAVALDYIDAISHEGVREILEKNELKPHLKKQWCIGRITGAYLACMEDVLHLYEQPYDADYPVVCIDELPCVLHNETILPLPMKSGRPLRQHYEYERAGTCSLFVALEPLTGYRMVMVSRYRKQGDYTRFMQQVAAHYQEASRIEIVQDNLNTHQAGSFYSALTPDAAWRLSQRFSFHYTPKKGSWPGMAEIELSVITRQCLSRRIGSMEVLMREVEQLVKERNAEAATVNWQFTPEKARRTLERHYNLVKLQ